MQNEFVLEMNGIHKSYGENKVLNDVSIKVRKGEIFSLLGENGAGKSTLMNILFGMPGIHATGGFDGEVILDGIKVNIKSPEQAMKYGIGMVHQEFMLIPGFTITENIKLNREITKSNPVSKVLGKKLATLETKLMEADARKALDILNMDIEEYTKVEGLPVGYMQFVEIAREIDKQNVKVLVFDEPTAVLTESEADNLITAMENLTKMGIAIIFITHRLDEVIQCTSNIAILRDGELVSTLKTEDTNVNQLAELMVGRKIDALSQMTELRDFSDKDNILELKDFVVKMPGEEVKKINLDVKRGEILGIGGLAGQGKIGVANGILGLYPTKGKMIMNGEEIPLNMPKTTMTKKVSFVSEDRKGIGLLLQDSIEKNIVITDLLVNNTFLKKYPFFTQIDKGKIREHANKMIEDFDIRCTGPEHLTGRLSGGNQQKVCLARAITMEPDLLLVSEPTRGIDIGAKKLVLDMIEKLNKEKGVTVIITSSELGELRSIADRIAIITEGKLAGILRPNDEDVKFGLMMSGKTDEEINEGEGRI